MQLFLSSSDDFLYIYIHAYAFIYYLWSVYKYATDMWRSGHNILQSVLSFYHVGPRIKPVVRLGGMFPHAQSHLAGPIAGYSLILLRHILKGLIFIFNFVYLCVGMYTYADACRIQKRASNPAELGFQEAVSCVMWLLETDLRSPALNSQAISLVPFSNLFFRVCVYNPALDHSQFLPCCLLLYGLTVQVPESPN